MSRKLEAAHALYVCVCGGLCMNAEGADKVSRKFESLKLLVVWHLRPRENRVKAKLKKPASVTVQQTRHASRTSCWLVTGPSGHVQREVLSSCAGRWRSPEPSDGVQAPNRSSGQLPGLGGSEIGNSGHVPGSFVSASTNFPTHVRLARFAVEDTTCKRLYPYFFPSAR